MKAQNLANRFRFLGWDALTEDEKSQIEENVRSVADLLPRTQGEVLFDLLDFKTPDTYVGLPDPTGDEAWKARADWERENKGGGAS